MVKKDILFLCQFFYPEHNSSATLPFDTAKYLASHGFTVDAMVGYPKEYNDETNVPLRERKDGVEIQRLRYIQLPRDKKFSRLVNYFSFTMSVFFRLFKLRKYKNVIVYSNPPILPIIPVMANALFGTKIIFVAYDIYPEIAFASKSLTPGNIIDKGMQWINHMLYKRVFKVIALTDEMKKFLLKHRPELTADRVTIIANWAHEQKTVPTKAAYERFGYDPGQFVVSYFGNMGICQEMKTLVEAIEKLNGNDQIKFLLCGHGNKQAAIRQRFEKQHLTNVQMYDFLTGAAFEQAIAISSCCVVTLEKGLKGMCAPSKYYSYLQGGKPVIAVVEEGSYLEKEITQEQIGISIQIGHTNDLVQALIELSNSQGKVAELGENTLQLYAREYTYEIAMGKYWKILSERGN